MDSKCYENRKWNKKKEQMMMRREDDGLRIREIWSDRLMFAIAQFAVTLKAVDEYHFCSVLLFSISVHLSFYRFIVLTERQVKLHMKEKKELQNNQGIIIWKLE